MRKIYWASMLLAGAALFTLQAHADSTDSSTTINGKMYTDLTDLTQDTNGTATNNQGYGLDIKRFYIGINHVFDDVWSANFTTDITYDKNGGYESPMVKTAFVQAKLSDAAIFQVGSANMPWIPFDEDVYGYRFVENTLIDRLHLGNSADYGVHFLGKSDGDVVNYNFAMVDGCGYKNPCRTKSMDYEGRVAFMPVSGLILAADAYTGYLGANTQSSPATNTATRQDALIAYKTKQFTIAGEYFHANNFSPALVTGPQTDSASGYSVYGDYVVADNGTAIFARYDNADPSKDLNPSEKDKYYNFGVSFPANSKITWALVYKHEDLSSNTSDTTTKEFGVWAQIVF
ncbi:MAG: carbohydrate porin [Gammaproteobacteria bacterium]|nr:carbohydrate porin [Gammaproteobacteria bacterium]